MSEALCTKDKVQVKLDVHIFSPDELVVKTDDDFLIITGHHEEKEDKDGFISRTFKRRYFLPQNANKDAINCEISSDGILQVTIPRVLPEEKDKNEKVHPIKGTGRPHN
jgi:HSP20 family molecular chaperone IbpA